MAKNKAARKSGSLGWVNNDKSVMVTWLDPSGRPCHRFRNLIHWSRYCRARRWFRSLNLLSRFRLRHYRFLNLPSRFHQCQRRFLTRLSQFPQCHCQTRRCRMWLRR